MHTEKKKYSIIQPNIKVEGHLPLGVIGGRLQDAGLTFTGILVEYVEE